jgi:hypothetical protein
LQAERRLCRHGCTAPRLDISSRFRQDGPMLRIESVSKQFRGGHFGVRNVSLDLELGVIGLLGPNGAVVVFLSFWYLVVNDRGANPWFDFAGFYGRASIITAGLYAAGSVTALVAAQTLYRARLRG